MPSPEPKEEIPRCPECGSDARRPKCLWELGGDCPRHAVRYDWERQQQAQGKVRPMEEIDEATYLWYHTPPHHDKVYVSQVVHDPAAAGQYYHLTAWGRRGYPLNTRRNGPFGLYEARNRHESQVRTKERGGYARSTSDIVLGGASAQQPTLGADLATLAGSKPTAPEPSRPAPGTRRIWDLDDEL